MDLRYASALAVFAVSLVGTRQLTHHLRRKGLMDIPNARSSHAIPTPRGGGIAVLISLALGFIYLYTQDRFLFDEFFLLGLALVSGISFLDDRFTLSPAIRIAVHFVAVSLVVYARGWIDMVPLPGLFSVDWSYLAWPLTFVWFLGVMNIYNFLDGIDGYAGTQAVVVGLGIMAIYPHPAAMMTGAVIIASSLGFLVFNWHPAKIFMGDVGAVSLGFTFAALPFYLSPDHIERGVFNVAIFLWFFLADGSFTILRRLKNREKIWLPHRSHLYQRLNIAGLSHSRIVASILPLQFTLISCLYVNQVLALVFACVAFGGLALATHLTEAKTKDS